MEIKKILILDDDRDLLNANQFLLKNQDFKVIINRNCKSGEKFLDNQEDIQITWEVWNE